MELQGLSDATIRAIEAPAAPVDASPVLYPQLEGVMPVVLSGSANEYAAYPEMAPVLESPQEAQRTELFMDYYSDLSR